MIFSVGTGIPPRIDAASSDEHPRLRRVGFRGAGLLGLVLQAAAIAGGWLGGVVGRRLAVGGMRLAVLGFAWAGVIAALTLTSRKRDPADAVRQIGPAALTGVVGLAVAGIVVTVLQVDGVRDVGDLTYGRLVLAKQALLAAGLAVSGIWTLEIIVRTAGLEDAIGNVSINSTQWDFQAPRLVKDAWRWPSVPPAVPVLLPTAAMVLGIGIGGVRRSSTIEPLPAIMVLSAIVAIAAGFAVQAVQLIDPAPAGHDARTPDGELDLVAAADDYRTYCLACHGPDGGGVDDSSPLHDHGSGTDLLDDDTRGRSNDDLLGLITEGVSGTTMPAYDIALTEQERWALVAYLRTLQRDRPVPTPEPRGS